MFSGKTRRRDVRVLIVYVAVSAFCGLFSAIYEYFSHGVYSAWMVFLFMWPLVGGALPYAVVVLVGLNHGSENPAGRWARLAHHAAIATLTVGACLSGVFEIYGTASGWVVFYWIAGGILALVAVIMTVVAAVWRGHGDGSSDLVLWDSRVE